MLYYLAVREDSESDELIAQLLRVSNLNGRRALAAQVVPIQVYTGSPSVSGAWMPEHYRDDYYPEHDWRSEAWAARHKVAAKIYGDSVGWIDLGVWQ